MFSLIPILSFLSLTLLLTLPLVLGSSTWSDSSLTDIESLNTGVLPPPPSEESLGQLIHVQILHRHGDRAPVHVNPKDAAMWRDRIGVRPGQLSKIGIAQLDAFGKHLRQTYIHGSQSFLPLIPGSAIKIRSTDVDRCLQSVHSMLDGLYPQSMIPVHTVTEDTEKLLQGTDKCPSYLLTYRSILADMDALLVKELSSLPHPPSAESSQAHDAEERGPPFNMLSYLAKASGWEGALQPANLISIMTDNLVCLKAHRLPLPPLLHHSFDLLRNYTKQIMFHKYSSFHVRRAWSIKNGIDFKLPDDKDGGQGSGMDPRGAVGGVLAKHIVHHWTDLVKAIKASQPNGNPSNVGGAARALLSVQSPLATLPIRPRLRAPLPGTILGKKGRRVDSLTDPVDEPVADGVQVPPESAAPPVEAGAKGPRKHLSRRERWKKHQMQLLAEEKMMVYSAHDTTILALFEALGLITTPHSEYLYPPYAASVTLELRKRPIYSDALNNDGSNGGDATTGDHPIDGYYVNALYGFPIPPEGSSGHPQSDQLWEYHRHPLALRCLSRAQAAAMELDDAHDKWQIDKQWSCPLSDFRRFIRFLSRGAGTAAPPRPRGPSHDGGYAPEDGCCEKLPSFYALGCDKRTANATELEEECLAFRTRCPNACEEGEKLDPLTLVCESSCTTTTGTSSLASSNGGGVGDSLFDPSSRSSVVSPSLSGDILSVGSVGMPLGPDAEPNVVRVHRDWVFMLFSLTCLLVGLYACFRAERARKEMRLGGMGVGYRQSIINAGGGVGDEDESNMSSDEEGLLNQAKRKHLSASTMGL